MDLSMEEYDQERIQIEYDRQNLARPKYGKSTRRDFGTSGTTKLPPPPFKRFIDTVK